MADFRSHEEQQRDQRDRDYESRSAETEARSALRRMEPQIADYKAEVKRLQDQMTELQAENAALTGALKAQMQGVEDIKGVLIERMDGLATDMDQVHRKIRGIAENDMKLVRELNDNQSARLARLGEMVKGS